jgi:exportin-5
VPVLTVDAHATVIETALKGYDKWRMSRELTPEEVSHNSRRPKIRL